MPIEIVEWPADPECSGNQWSIADVDTLAHLTALVLVGRVHHVARILAGSQPHAAVAPGVLKDRLRAMLFPAPGSDPWHRDGWLFEVISWIAARISAGDGDVMLDPHTRSTQQGIDSLRISFDHAERRISRATIYEYKCTENPRAKFRDEVLPAFQEYESGARDNELLQAAVGLLQQMALSDEEQIQTYDQMLNDRPLAFQAALTVTPEQYETEKCVALFKGFSSLTAAAEDRIGDTLPLEDVRAWFANFAARVWAKIELSNV